MWTPSPEMVDVKVGCDPLTSTAPLGTSLQIGGPVNPLPESLAEIVRSTGPRFQPLAPLTGGAVIDSDGAFLSTLFPPTGPAVAQLPATSQTGRLFVTALLVSVSAAVLVGNEKAASAVGFARSETASRAVHGTFTSAACQTPSGVQLTTGGALSRLTASGGMFGGSSLP